MVDVIRREDCAQAQQWSAIVSMSELFAFPGKLSTEITLPDYKVRILVKKLSKTAVRVPNSNQRSNQTFGEVASRRPTLNSTRQTDVDTLMIRKQSRVRVRVRVRAVRAIYLNQTEICHQIFGGVGLDWCTLDRMLWVRILLILSWIVFFLKNWRLWLLWTFHQEISYKKSEMSCERRMSVWWMESSDPPSRMTSQHYIFRAFLWLEFD